MKDIASFDSKFWQTCSYKTPNMSLEKIDEKGRKGV